MAILGTGAYALNQINLIRLQTARELGKTSRDLAEGKAEERNEAAKAKAEARIDQMESELAAAEVRDTSFGIGAVWGAVVSFASTLSMAVASPLVGPLVGGELLALAGALPAALAGAGIAGMSLGGIAKGLAEPFATIHVHDALDAEKDASSNELAIKQSDAQIRESKEATEEERKTAKNVRDRIFADARSDQKRRTSLNKNIGGKNADAALPAGGASQVASVQRAAAAIAFADELDARQAARDATQEQLSHAVDAHHMRVRAADEKAENATWRAVFAVGRAVAEVAANVCTVGGYSAAGAIVSVASSSINLGEKLITDEDARRMNRAAEVADLRAEVAKNTAADARASAKASAQTRKRILQATEQVTKANEGGQVMVRGVLTTLAAIQQAQSQALMMDEQDGRKDERDARADEIAQGQAAIAARRSADDMLSAQEDRAVVFAAIQVGVSVAGATATIGNTDTLGKVVSDDAQKITEGVTDVADKLVNAAQTWSQAQTGSDERAERRRAEATDLKKKQAEHRAEDAEDAQEDARDSRQRALDALLAVQRNLAPSIA